MSVARSRLIQRFGRDWMIYALFHCGVEYLISQNSGFWDSLYLALLFSIIAPKVPVPPSLFPILHPAYAGLSRSLDPFAESFPISTTSVLTSSNHLGVSMVSGTLSRSLISCRGTFSDT